MPYHLLADIVTLMHLAFVVFVLVGGLLVWRWSKLMWAHLPSAMWGIAIEWTGAVCPLTPWEIWLRRQAGQEGYESSFIERYVLPTLYPTGLTRTGQIVLGCIALLINVWVYGWFWYSRHRRP